MRSPALPAGSRADRMGAHASDATRLLKTLANEKRLMILCLLVEGVRAVGELNACVDLSQSALSQHLAVLRDEGLVTTRREAQTIYYRLASDNARRLIGLLYDMYCGPEMSKDS